MIDRCKQALVKLALEPEWEAKFEPHSYGFRPDRGTHDAIAAILVAIEGHPTFVFDADIEGAFDHVKQAMVLLAPQEHSPGVKTIISPSPEASKRHLAAIDQRLQQLQTAPQARVIAELNPLIAGWAAYYNGIVPAATMSRYDDLVEQRLMRWASKRHPGKEHEWLLTRYWHSVGKQKRVFATHDGVQLRAYRQASILRG